MHSHATKATLLLAATLTTLTACSSGSEGGSAPATSSATSSSSSAPTPAPAAKISLETKKVRGDEVSSDLSKFPISVKATGGTLSTVEVLDSKGAVVKDVSVSKPSAREWRIGGLLAPSSSYTLKVRGVNSQGKATEKSEALRTFTPSATNSFTVFPYGNMKVGVGMPVTVTFKASVGDRKAVESHLKVKSSQGEKGSWGWIDDRTVVWKPDTFWKSGSKVNVSLNTKGLRVGNGVYGTQNVDTSFSVGRKLQVEVSNATKEATVTQDGKKLRSFPVSMGKPGHSTSSGWNIIYEKQSPVRMKGEDYDDIVYYAQRYNATGEYLHSAPWSTWAQGNTNVSHGCVNIGPSNAKWLYGITIPGDLVHITGTAEQADKWDGMGAIWNYSPREWKGLSALSDGGK